MADSQKLTALKKAYAEIILNTAKEAAARIMTSERKALRYQQELFAAKDESLRILLRLKQMLDAKANESKTMSLNQQKRIEELEAQLGEAEDIVRDLREELREAHDELEKLSKYSLHCPGEQKSNDAATSVKSSQENTINNVLFVRSFPDAQTNLAAVSDINSSVLTGTNVGNKSSCKDNCYVCNPDFASIVMKRKEPDQYRNGCTHRIRALERCLLNDNSSLSGQVDDAKNENILEGEEGKGMHTKSSLRADMSRPEEKTDELNVMQSDVDNIIQVRPLSSFLGKRKRAARYKRNKAPSSMNTLDHLVALCQQPDLLCTESLSQAADGNAQFGEDSRIIEHDSQKGPHSPSITSSPSAAAKVVTESESGDLSCKLDLEMVDVSAVSLDVKVPEITERSSPQPENNKFIVYTFKRKRKKDLLSSPDRDCSRGADVTKRKIQEKQYDSLDSEKSTLTTESSQDSPGLAEVACQLMSLSEKLR